MKARLARCRERTSGVETGDAGNEPAPRPLDGKTAAQAGQNVDPLLWQSLPPGEQRPGVSERAVDRGPDARPLKVGLGDTDDRVGMAAIQRDALSDDSPVATEVSAPGEMAENEDGMGIEAIVIRTEQTPESGPGAENVEVSARGRGSEDVQRRLLALQGSVVEARSGAFGEELPGHGLELSPVGQ